MKTIFYTALIAAFTTLAAAFPNGSPVCSVNATQMLAVPNTPMGKQGALGFSLTYNFPNNQYTPGKQYMISIKGNSQFQGLLLWSLAMDKSHPGQFNLPTGYKYVTAAPCPGDPKATVTHTDGSNKGATNFMWTAPTTPSTGPVQFVAAVVGGSPPQFQIIKDGQMFNAVGGAAPTTNNTTGTSNNSTGTTTSSTTDTSGSGSGYGSGSGSGSDTGSATTTSVSPTDSNTANSAQGGSNVSAAGASSSDAQSLRSTSSWIILGSTLVLAKFLVAFI